MAALAEHRGAAIARGGVTGVDLDAGVPAGTRHRAGRPAARRRFTSRSGPAIARPSPTGKTFESPSGAGRYIKGSATNGWSFWRLPDGRRLLDLRAVYTGTDPAKATSRFDWSALHTILEALPVGYWTAYGSLADAVGTAAQPLGNHVSTCHHCSNVHRVLKSDGAIAAHFRWSDPTEERDPMEMLRAEGALVDDKPDPARELSSDDLQVLIEQ